MRDILWTACRGLEALMQRKGKGLGRDIGRKLGCPPAPRVKGRQKRVPEYFVCEQLGFSVVYHQLHLVLVVLDLHRQQTGYRRTELYAPQVDQARYELIPGRADNA